jgi:cytochrome P450
MGRDRAWLEPRALVRWGLRHGVARIGFRAARNDRLARLIMDPALRANPYPLYDELRTTPVAPGRVAAVTTRHALADAVLRDPTYLVGFAAELLPRPARALLAWSEEPAGASAFERPSMAVTNGPEHTRYRRVAMKAFTARAIAGLEQHVETIAATLLDEMTARHNDGSPADVIAEFAEILPVLVIAEVLGVPVDMRPTFRDWATAIVSAADMGVDYRSVRASERAMAELGTWMLAHLRELRAHPGDNLFSRMVNAADEEARAGEPALDENGLIANGMLLLLAGFETTVNLIGNAIELLLAHPDQLAALREDPAGWPNAVEEVLRFAPPVLNVFRYRAAATELEGVRIKRGQYLVVLIGGANRDPAVFDDPHRFDVRRPNAKDNLSFGGGGHFCVGAALARLEGAIALRLLFERFPDLAAAGTPTRRPTRLINGLAALPVTTR